MTDFAALSAHIDLGRLSDGELHRCTALVAEWRGRPLALPWALPDDLTDDEAAALRIQVEDMRLAADVQRKAEAVVYVPLADQLPDGVVPFRRKSAPVGA